MLCLKHSNWMLSQYCTSLAQLITWRPLQLEYAQLKQHNNMAPLHNKVWLIGVADQNTAFVVLIRRTVWSKETSFFHHVWHRDNTGHSWRHLDGKIWWFLCGQQWQWWHNWLVYPCTCTRDNYVKRTLSCVVEFIPVQLWIRTLDDVLKSHWHKIDGFTVVLLLF